MREEQQEREEYGVTLGLVTPAGQWIYCWGASRKETISPKSSNKFPVDVLMSGVLLHPSLAEDGVEQGCVV